MLQAELGLERKPWKSMEGKIKKHMAALLLLGRLLAGAAGMPKGGCCAYLISMGKTQGCIALKRKNVRRDK